MTLDELQMLENAILDGAEAYIDARIENLPYSHNEIGTITEVTEDERKRRLHTVRVGTKTRYKLYKKVQSLGNVKMEVGNVVLVLIPSGNTSECFVLGKLDFMQAAIIGGTISIGEIPGSNPTDYYFKVDDKGNVTIKSGSLYYNWNSTLQDYSFKLDKNGIKSGIFSNNGKNDWYFNLDNNGNLKMSKGSITLGKLTGTKYRFEANDSGQIICRDSAGNETFKADENGVTIRDYLHNGAFNRATPNDATTINGNCITTGFIKSSNLSGQSTFAAYNGNFTTNGTIISLTNGFISCKNFLIDGSGNAKFKGKIESTEGNIGGWEIGPTRLHKKDGWWADTSTELTTGHLRFVDSVNGAWPRTVIKNGQIVVNTANQSDGYGVYVCNGGSNTDNYNDGNYVWISGTGIGKRADGVWHDVAWGYDISGLKKWVEDNYQPKGSGGDYVKFDTSYHYGTYTDQQGNKWISISNPNPQQ